MFNRKREIEKQIEEYALWKYERHPYIAGGEKALLDRFAKTTKIANVSDITQELAAYFVASQDYQYAAQRVLVALRGFLRYARWAGYPCIHYIHLTHSNLMAAKPGPKIDQTKIEKIKELKGRGLTYRQIVVELSQIYKKRIHLSGVQRWAKLAGL